MCGIFLSLLIALQDLEPQQLLLFVQSFGIPVSSMSKLLQYLDQAVSHDPQTLEQNIMDKSEDNPACIAAFIMSSIGPCTEYFNMHIIKKKKKNDKYTKRFW